MKKQTMNTVLKRQQDNQKMKEQQEKEKKKQEQKLVPQTYKKTYDETTFDDVPDLE